VRELVSFLLAVALGTNAAHGLADPHRVALVRGDDELFRQLSLALQAWEVETLPLDVAPPAATQPEAMNQATGLSRQLGLDGVVWVTDAPQGSLLWVYDARSGEITTRVIEARPPFGSATAAGLALSVKTTLKASVEPSPTPPPRPTPALQPTPTLSPQPRTERPRRTAPRAQALALLDAQVVARASIRAWYSVHSAIWLGPSRRVGVGLRLGLGSVVPLKSELFNGDFHELAFGPTGGLRVTVSTRLLTQAFVGATLHAVELGGARKSDGRRVEMMRYDVSLDGGAQLQFRLAKGTLIGLQLGVAYFLGYQRYLVEGQPVFSPLRLQPSGGVHVGFELD